MKKGEKIFFCLFNLKLNTSFTLYCKSVKSSLLVYWGKQQKKRFEIFSVSFGIEVKMTFQNNKIKNKLQIQS